MDTLLLSLIEAEKKYRKIIELISAQLQQMPDGQLRISHNGNIVKYYCHTGDKRYLNKSDYPLVVALAQKDYYHKILSSAKIQYKHIKQLLDYYNPSEFESVYDNLNAYRQSLVTPVIQPIDVFVKEWESVEYGKRIFDGDSPEIYTERGERVLSKSEKILADKFSLMRVPYRYEFPITLSTIGEIHPDFTLLNKQTRCEFFWEHLGRMDDPEYAEKATQRILAYEKDGYILGKNLLVTFETQRQPLNMRFVESLIRTFLL